MSSLLLLANQLKEVAVGYTVGLVTLIIIGVSLLIILYRILKWIIKIDERMSVLREVVQKKRKKIAINKNSKSWIEKSFLEENSLPNVDVYFQDKNYLEFIFEDGKYYSATIFGNGDFNHHQANFEFIH